MDRFIVQCGRFTAKVTTNCKQTSRLVKKQYAQINQQNTFIDYEVHVLVSSGVRKLLKPQARFFCNGKEPFAPMPADQAYPLFEWGMNWAVTQHFQQALVIHAAVVTKGDVTLVMPGLPGAGKSTLCAALVYGGGWRLLSDELTLYQRQQHKVLPNPRPVSLKNQSIKIIEENFNVEMTPLVTDTIKGTVAHTKVNQFALSGVNECPSPTHILFPKYDGTQSGDFVELENHKASDCFFQLADNSFNYSVLGSEGFLHVKQLIQSTELLGLRYGGKFEPVFSLLDELKG